MSTVADIPAMTDSSVSAFDRTEPGIVIVEVSGRSAWNQGEPCTGTDVHGYEIWLWEPEGSGMLLFLGFQEQFADAFAPYQGGGTAIYFKGLPGFPAPM